MTISKQAARVAEIFARRPWWILAIALSVSALAGWAAAQLPIYTSRQALLPKNTPVTDRLNAFLKDFGAASDLVAVLEGLSRQEMEAYATALAEKLRNQPEIAQATDRMDMDFFLEHAYLLAPTESLKQLDTVVGKAAKETASSGGTRLEEYLAKALIWIKDHPPLAELDADIGHAEENLGVANFFLEEWRRWLTADNAPSRLDWNRLNALRDAGNVGNGYFASRDGRMLFLFVHPANSSEDFQSIGPFVDTVKRVSAELAAQWRKSGRIPPTLGLTGLPAIEYEEFVNIRKDITLVVSTSAVLIALLILAVARSVRWALIVFVPMGVGVLWSLGLALATIGHLTIITAAFIAILFGLGADYGIFTSSRIAEERRAGKPLIEAIGSGIGSSFGTVLTAGLASVLIFGALGTVEFPGFSELGVVAAKGVLMILISTWLIQPALYALMPPKIEAIPQKSAVISGPGHEAALQMGPPRAFLGTGTFPRPVAFALVAVAFCAAGLGAFKGLGIPFDYDVLSMLPKNSEAARYQRRMVEESDYQSEVVIFTAKDMEEARRITGEAEKLKSIAKVQSLVRLFPKDAEVRAQLARSIGESSASENLAEQIREIDRTGLPAKTFESLRQVIEGAIPLIDEAQEQAFSSGHGGLVKSLDRLRENFTAIQAKISKEGASGRERSEAFLRTLLKEAASGLKVLEGWRQAQPLVEGQLPSVLRDRFFSRGGKIAIYAFPAKSVYDPDNLDQLMTEVYSVSPEATGFPTTHQAFSKSVVRSFSRGTMLALAISLLWIALALRSPVGIALAALPLLIGGGWMLGLMSLIGIRYNYANIVALPLVIALAVDYGVWFSYRWRELKDFSPLQVSMISGKVIALAAGTELAGLGAITLASYRGVSTMGISITIGLLCCLSATLLVAPAIGQLLDPKEIS